MVPWSGSLGQYFKRGECAVTRDPTVVKGIHVKDDFEEIRYLVHGCTNYYIQNYKPSENILNPQNLSPFSKEELQEFADIIKPYVQNVHLRGI